MASLRKLDRRRRRWVRYIQRYVQPYDWGYEYPGTVEPPGFWRVEGAIQHERLQRRVRRRSLLPEMPF
jgi:hypothetical protein